LPPGEKRSPLHIKLPPALLDARRRCAEGEGVTPTEIVERAIKRELKRRTKKPRPE